MESTTLPASDLNMNKEVESFSVNNQKKNTSQQQTLKT